MEVSFNQNIGIPPLFKNLASAKESDEKIELTEFDNQVINYVKALIADKNPLESLSSALEESVDWRLDILNHMNRENKGKGELSHKGLVEIIKLLASDNPNFIMLHLQHAGIHDEVSILEIARVCIEKRPVRAMIYIKDFNINSQVGLSAFYKLCIENCIKDNP
jgi:hypothetical protein